MAAGVRGRCGPRPPDGPGGEQGHRDRRVAIAAVDDTRSRRTGAPRPADGRRGCDDRVRADAASAVARTTAPSSAGPAPGRAPATDLRLQVPQWGSVCFSESCSPLSTAVAVRARGCPRTRYRLSLDFMNRISWRCVRRARSMAPWDDAQNAGWSLTTTRAMRGQRDPLVTRPHVVKGSPGLLRAGLDAVIRTRRVGGDRAADTTSPNRCALNRCPRGWPGSPTPSQADGAPAGWPRSSARDQAADLATPPTTARGDLLRPGLRAAGGRADLLLIETSITCCSQAAWPEPHRLRPPAGRSPDHQ